MSRVPKISAITHGHAHGIRIAKFRYDVPRYLLIVQLCRGWKLHVRRYWLSLEVQRRRCDNSVASVEIASQIMSSGRPKTPNRRKPAARTPERDRTAAKCSTIATGHPSPGSITLQDVREHVDDTAVLEAWKGTLVGKIRSNSQPSEAWKVRRREQF